MREKIKVDFLIISRIKGTVVKQSSVYEYALDRKTAEKKAYERLTKEFSPNRSDIILIDHKEE